VKRSQQTSLHVYDGSGVRAEESNALAEGGPEDVAAVIAELETDMADASARLEFERAAVLRDQIQALRSGDFRKAAQPQARGNTRGKGRGGAGGYPTKGQAQKRRD
jgi:excinuclease ABC subunit B